MQGLSSPSNTTTGVGNNVLIPVDFSEMSNIAVKFGFEIAQRLDLTPTILYASPIPLPIMYNAYPEDMGGLDNESVQVEEMEVGVEIYHNAEHRMKLFKKQLAEWQNNGQLLKIPFKTVVEEGMPEEVIRDYCKFNNPDVLVMATRGIRKKEEELVGSVTAEVLDNCRKPLFAIPEDYSLCSVKSIVRLVAICQLEGQDVACVQKLMQMFGNPSVNIWLVPLAEKIEGSRQKVELDNILALLKEKFPDSKFESVELYSDNRRKELEDFLATNDIQMIIVPNKKKNFFARLFNPGIAHRILFEKDIPLLALPV